VLASFRFDVVLLCRSVVEPQQDLGASASPSRMMSADPKVMGESLVDDARTATLPRAATPPRGPAESRATSPPMADTRMASPPRTCEAGEGTIVGDIGATVSPRIIDVDPISARPTEVDDLVKDQPQIDQAPGGPGTSGAQVPESSSSSPRLPCREINWNGTPWQDDIFEDNEDM
jgi:hypothetical protein